jgi:crotonobetainyl-CoA:carnitine CoA-transferase CaiB-like acyl-CoA transferase
LSEPVRFSVEGKGPLNGVRVLDLSRLVAGNMLSLQLADFGADVIKVESPEGDSLRAWLDGGEPLFWKTYSRNKRSIMLNLRNPKASAALWRLIEGADVFIENFRPGTLEKMGFAPDDMLRRNPRLIVVRVSGFGQTGPYAQQPGFGTLVEAMSGLAARSSTRRARSLVSTPRCCRRSTRTSASGSRFRRTWPGTSWTICGRTGTSVARSSASKCSR